MKRTPLRRMSEKQAKAHPHSRSTFTAPRAGIRKKPRPAKETARIYGEHAAHVRQRPCCACGYAGATEAAHTTTGGMGRKADASTLVPLCGPHQVIAIDGKSRLVEGCHRESHRIGVKSFERKYGLSLSFIASRLFAERSARAGRPEGEA